MRSDIPRRLLHCAITALVASGYVMSARGASGPKFYADDPVLVDADTGLNASGAIPIELGNYSDFVENTFGRPADRRQIRALNVNTLDEVPDSSWFTNRIGRRQMSMDEIVLGPDRVRKLAAREWLIVKGKDAGRQPGFRAVDPSDPTRQIYQIEFDPPGNPEMATGAEVIGTALYHAMGYNVVDVYLIEIDPATLRISPDAMIRDARGRRRFTQADLKAVFTRAARRPDGRYHALASRWAEGENLGQFRYHGTRPDDPNDIYPHEHRRELRANRIFCAWLNHDDSRAINTLDMLVGPPAAKYLKHYMFDFGSILGSGTDAPDHIWAGREYVLDKAEGLRALVSLGLYIRPSLRVRYADLPPAVGRVEADRFEPVDWKPHYPNAAFDNMRPEDALWGARIVASFSDEAIAAVVRKAQYSDPRATDYLTGVLIKRRDKIAKSWLNAVNPVIDPRLTADGLLTFENAAVRAGAATPATAYELAWSRFDNLAVAHEVVGAPIRVAQTSTWAPLAALEGSEYVAVKIRSYHPAHPAWAAPVTVYFRGVPGGWQTVGIERVEELSTPRAMSARRF